MVFNLLSFPGYCNGRGWRYSPEEAVIPTMLWTSTTVLWTTVVHVMVEDCMVQAGLSVVLYMWLLILNKHPSLRCCRAVITGKQNKWFQSIRTIVPHFWCLEAWDPGSNKATLLGNSHARFYLVCSHPWLLTLQHSLSSKHIIPTSVFSII